MLKKCFHISGMKCGGCAYTIQKHFMRLKGVKEASVSYLKHELRIRYDERSLHGRELIDSIAPLGYSLQEIKTI